MTKTTQAEPYAKTVHFTEQQIEDFCETVELGFEVIPKTTAAIAVQIIRQLQEKRK